MDAGGMLFQGSKVVNTQSGDTGCSLPTYGETPEIRQRLIDLVDGFPRVWTENTLVDIPQDMWMTLPVKPGADLPKTRGQRYTSVTWGPSQYR